MNRKGFVCVYFLAMFLVIASCSALLMEKAQNRLKTEINIKRADKLLAEEAAVLSYVKCQIANEKTEDECTSANGVSFCLVYGNDHIEASLRSPDQEILQIEYDQEKKTVYDYDVIRSEMAAS